LTPIASKIQKAFQTYQLTRCRTKEKPLVDFDMGVTYWHRPAETIIFRKENDEETSTIKIFIERSKSDQEVGAGIVIYRSGSHIKSLKYRLNKRCINNQAEQLAILKALV
jgi:hypothetical protein